MKDERIGRIVSQTNNCDTVKDATTSRLRGRGNCKDAMTIWGRGFLHRALIVAGECVNCLLIIDGELFSGITINVRAVGVDAQRKRIPIDATWTVVDPELATVSPAKDSEVRITVHKEGQSELVVTSDNVWKTMVIKCAQQDGVWRVDISQ
jgi:hypothetical protein